MYQQITNTLTDEQSQFLDRMLVPQENERISDFALLKQVPGRSTLKQMRLWIKRLNWLNTLIDTVPLIKSVAYTKIRQFAAEAEALEATDILDIRNVAKRHTLLICLIHLKRVQTRDQLITMLLKRMKQTHKRGKEKLLILQQESRELEEQMMAAFSQVIHCAAKEQSDTNLGMQVRTVLDNYGGVEALLAREASPKATIQPG